jgi:hypothetical protein
MTEAQAFANGVKHGCEELKARVAELEAEVDELDALYNENMDKAWREVRMRDAMAARVANLEAEVERQQGLLQTLKNWFGEQLSDAEAVAAAIVASQRHE